MDDVQKFIDDAQSALRSMIEAAYSAGFEAGKKQGERDASAGLKAKLSAILSDESSDEGKRHNEHTDFNHLVTVSSDKSTVGDDGERAAPGTVKPAILSAIANTQNGMFTREIVAATGFKPNSVRGTLWTLHKEGSILKSDSGRWIASPSVSEKEKSATMAAYQEAVRNSEAPPEKPESASEFTGGRVLLLPPKMGSGND